MYNSINIELKYGYMLKARKQKDRKQKGRTNKGE